MRTVLKIDDLYKIVELLDDGGYNDIPLTITNEILTKERLYKINEEISKESGNTINKEDIQELNEVNVKINNITFCYKLVDYDI